MTSSPPFQDDLTRITQDYRPVLMRYLPRRAEDVRAAAYELGRRAFVRGIPLLDVCRMHQQVTMEVLSGVAQDEVLSVHDATDELLLEVLAAYEMTHGGVFER